MQAIVSRSQAATGASARSSTRAIASENTSILAPSRAPFSARCQRNACRGRHGRPRRSDARSKAAACRQPVAARYKAASLRNVLHRRVGRSASEQLGADGEQPPRLQIGRLPQHHAVHMCQMVSRLASAWLVTPSLMNFLNSPSTKSSASAKDATGPLFGET
jgi:hypothetical protein